MLASPHSLLFCDYDGDFEFSDDLTRIGYSVDRVRPDALKQVTIGEHEAYIFAARNEAALKEAAKTCEKLKQAELKTPLLLLTFSDPPMAKRTVDAFIPKATLVLLLDHLDHFVGSPMPPSLKGSFQLLSEDRVLREALVKAQGRVKQLEEQVATEQKAFKPKLQAILHGQKLQMQTETERLKVELSEMEAKLLDREMKIRELENAAESSRLRLEEAALSHEKAQQALRDFYQNKIRALEEK